MREIVYLFLFLLISTFAQAQQINRRTSSTINMEGTEYYYTLENEGKTLLYRSLKDNAGDWLDGLPVESFNAAIQGTIIVAPFISYDNRTLYFSAKVLGSPKFDLYYSEREGDKWLPPIILPDNINTAANESTPSVSSDNMHLYFTRKAQGGDEELKNCNTIYHSTRKPSGEWDDPTPLGFPINAGCETTPLIAADGKTLFFSSDRFSVRKRRKFAILYSRQVADGVWTTPVPVDTLTREYDEFSPTLDYSAKEMRTTRIDNYKKEPTAYRYRSSLPLEFFQCPFTIVNGLVSHASGKPMECTIRVIENFTFQPVSQTKSSSMDGSYRFIVPNGKRYVAEFYADTTTRIVRTIVPGETEGARLTENVRLFSRVNLSLEVYDESAMEPVDAKITVKEAGELRKIQVQKATDGCYTLKLPVNKTFELLVEKEGYASKTLQVALNAQQQFEDLIQVVFLQPNLRTCEVRVVDMSTNLAMPALVALRNLDRKEAPLAAPSQTGVYVFNLRKDSRYELSIFKKGYLYFLAGWGADANRLKQTLEVKLVPLAGMGKLELIYLAFNPTTTDLSADSWGELKCLTRLLKDNPDYTFHLMVPSVDTEDARRLADQRVVVLRTYFDKQSLPVVNYLVEIDARKPAGPTTGKDKPLDRISIQATTN